jgi:hypothetical protein
MNQANSQKNNIPGSPEKARRIQNIYDVPRDFDKTTTTLLSLDHYLTNKDVYSIVQTLFSETRNWSQWAVEHPYDAECYFSPPYTCRQAFLLGYNVVAENHDNGNGENHNAE